MSHEESIRFLLQISLMLAVALTMGLGLRRFLGFPLVFGEIIGGILLGPTVLGSISPDLQTWLFPMNGSIAIGRDAIVKLGLLSFLFAAGLEMNIKNVGKQRWSVVFTSLGGILLPFTLGYGLVKFWPSLWQTEGNFNQLLPLFMGTALAISALPVIARILLDLNLEKTELAATILAAATIDDLIGWSLFATILSQMSPSDSKKHIWLSIVAILLLSAFILTMGRRIAQKSRPWFRAQVTGVGGRICIAAILTLITASIVEAIGVHGVFGAFLAGLALSQGLQEREREHEIVHQFAIGVFAPLYFVSIGLKTNFLTHFDIKLIIVILIVACLGKIIGASAGSLLGKMPLRRALAVGFGMNARGAMEIVLASLALDYRLIDQRIFVALVFMALVTSLMSGPIMTVLLKNQERANV